MRLRQTPPRQSSPRPKPVRRRGHAGAWLAALLALAPVAGRADDEGAPYQSIRALHRLQEQIAHGGKAAQAAQPALMTTMAARFLDADPAVWRDPRNASAAVLFLFSGGKPAVIRAILARSTMPREIDRLLKGALAYAEGQDQIARDLLDPIDPRSLPSALGGQLALVEATLVAPSDPKKAAHFFDLARLLVPGSLVEEAALRRQIMLETDPASLGKFVALSRQYLHRFQTSIYAQNFKEHFAAEALRLAASGDVGEIDQLAPVIAELPPDEQRALDLAVAKAAVVNGRTAAARYAAGRAAAMASPSSRDGARARLYIDAASIGSGDVAKGVAALEAADSAHLSPADIALRDAALAVAYSVAAPVADPVADPVANPVDGVTAAPAPAPDGNSVADRARQAISAGDALLEQAQ